MRIGWRFIIDTQIRVKEDGLLKLLMIAPAQNPVPPITGGSVEHSLYQISKRLSLKHDVTLLSRQFRHQSRHNRLNNLDLLRVPAVSRNTYITAAMNRVKSNHYDMIQIDNRPAYIPIVRKYFPRTCIVLFLHSLAYVTPPITTKQNVFKQLSEADLIVGNSQSLENHLGEMFPAYKAKITHVHLGVDSKQFRPPSVAERLSARRKYGIDRQFAVVYAGRLISRKGIPVIIRALKLLRKSIPSITLVVAGGTANATYKRYLRNLAAAQQVKVKFVGNVPRNKMHTLYWMADCFVCPSQKHEAFGLVVVEALASGVPTVASAIGGITEIIRHQEDGLLVKKYHHPAEFAKSIRAVALDRKLSRRLATRGPIRVRRMFHWDRTAESLGKKYEAAISSRSAT